MVDIRKLVFYCIMEDIIKSSCGLEKKYSILSHV